MPVASGLRQNETTIVCADDVAKIAKIWSPNDGAQWQQLTAGLSGGDRARLIQLLVERVTYDREKETVSVAFHSAWFEALLEQTA
jgi:hypothetical protein